MHPIQKHSCSSPKRYARKKSTPKSCTQELTNPLKYDPSSMQKTRLRSKHYR